MSNSIVYTLGHSTLSMKEFLTTLSEYSINAMVDVRSYPYSKFVPHFNQESLKSVLKKENIYYISLGNCLGARWNSMEVLSDQGRVDFNKVAQTEIFRSGLDRVVNGVNDGYSIVLLCSERNPIVCHRFSLISRFLRSRISSILHIVGGEVYDHDDILNGLTVIFSTSNRVEVDLDYVMKARHMEKQESLFGGVGTEVVYVALNRLIGYIPK